MPNLYLTLLDRQEIAQEENIEGLLEGLGDENRCELYEAMIWFGRIWSWQPSETLKMPIRRRSLLLDQLSKHVKKFPPMG